MSSITLRLLTVSARVSWSSSKVGSRVYFKISAFLASIISVSAPSPPGWIYGLGAPGARSLECQRSPRTAETGGIMMAEHSSSCCSGQCWACHSPWWTPRMVLWWHPHSEGELPTWGVVGVRISRGVRMLQVAGARPLPGVRWLRGPGYSPHSTLMWQLPTTMKAFAPGRPSSTTAC